jgi:hypothetical protein
VIRSSLLTEWKNYERSLPLHIFFMLFGYITYKAIMRYAMLLIVFVLLVAVDALAETRGAMPYGDYPQFQNAYGISKESLGSREAEMALEKYFAGQGLKASNLRHRDRFIEAEIYKGDRLFDKVLFDRKTGRIRSIY